MTPTTRTTTVVNVRSPEWKAAVAAGTAVYIGRASPGFKKSYYGNMYKSPRDGTRDEVVEKYKAAWRFYLDGSFAKAYRPLLEDLRGKVLGCWCAPKRCHGHALVELLEERKWA